MKSISMTIQIRRTDLIIKNQGSTYGTLVINTGSRMTTKEYIYCWAHLRYMYYFDLILYGGLVGSY